MLYRGFTLTISLCFGFKPPNFAFASASMSSILGYQQGFQNQSVVVSFVLLCLEWQGDTVLLNEKSGYDQLKRSLD